MLLSPLPIVHQFVVASISPGDGKRPVSCLVTKQIGRSVMIARGSGRGRPGRLADESPCPTLWRRRSFQGTGRSSARRRRSGPDRSRGRTFGAPRLSRGCHRRPDSSRCVPPGNGVTDDREIRRGGPILRQIEHRLQVRLRGGFSSSRSRPKPVPSTSVGPVFWLRIESEPRQRTAEDQNPDYKRQQTAVEPSKLPAGQQDSQDEHEQCGHEGKEEPEARRDEPSVTRAGAFPDPLACRCHHTADGTEDRCKDRRDQYGRLGKSTRAHSKTKRRDRSQRDAREPLRSRPMWSSLPSHLWQSVSQWQLRRARRLPLRR